MTEKTMAGLKLENFRSQMNPHFIFNALNSIQDYIISNEKELASKYLVKFSRLIRMYLDHSQQNMISLKQEITALNFYLELEKVRFDDALYYEININESVNPNQIKIPSLFIQPYVENAIKHGLLHKQGDKKLIIDFNIESNFLKITIEDNGVGRARAQEINKASHKSFSTKANQERIKLYKNKLNLDITVITEDLKDANNKAIGTRVIIYIPI
jgi:LytS/YehU family sensor histidine kinase